MGGCIFKAGCLLSFLTIRVGAYLRTWRLRHSKLHGGLFKVGC